MKKDISILDITHKQDFVVGEAPMIKLENSTFVNKSLIICLCLRGSASLHIDLQHYELKEGMEYIIFPNSVVTVVNRSIDFLIQFCAVREEIFDDISILLGASFWSFLNDCDPYQHDTRSRQAIDSFFYLLKELYHQPDHLFREQMLRNYINNHFLDIYHHTHQYFSKVHIEGSNVKEKLFKQYTKLIGNHYAQEREVQFYADKMCITPRYLSAVCNELVNMSAKKCIDTYVILQIKVLLNVTNSSIQQIAHQLNFTDQSSLTRFFKTHTTMTPSQYRQARMSREQGR